MLNQKRFLSIILLLIIPSVFAFSQTQTLRDNTKQSNDFVSVGGKFTIALPIQTIGSRNVEPLEGKTKGGKQFFWETTQGIFTAGYVELYKPEDGKGVAETTTAELVEQVFGDGGKLISKREASFQGNSGLEVTMRLKNAVIVIGRHIISTPTILDITIFLFSRSVGIFSELTGSYKTRMQNYQPFNFWSNLILLGGLLLLKKSLALTMTGTNC